MKNLLDARGLRRLSATAAIAAGSILLVAPVAGASAGQTPEPAAQGQAQAEANSPEQQADGQATSDAASQQGQEASADRPGSVPPENSNAGGNSAQAPEPNNGAAEPESPGASGEHKQTICHRTRSATNPYVVITVDFHAVDGQMVEAQGQGDHAAQHDTEAVFDPSIHDNGDDWGDIIPPFTTEWGSFGGLNWDEGKAIFDNGCELPDTEVGGDTETGGENGTGGDDGTGGDEVTGEQPVGEEQPVVEEQPATDVEGDVVTRGETPAPGTDVIGTAGTPTAPQTEVLGSVVNRTPAQTAAVGGAQISSLPRTGNGTGLLAAAGAGLVGLGLLLVRGSRRAALTA